MVLLALLVSAGFCWLLLVVLVSASDARDASSAGDADSNGFCWLPLVTQVMRVM